MNNIKITDDLKEMETLSENFLKMHIEVEDKIRQLTSKDAQQTDILSVHDKKRLDIYVLEDKTPWAGLSVKKYDMPAMISDEERKYYKWIGQFYSGKGEVVELGPWLGCSTLHILDGLIDNPNFSGRKLFVYDDFTWRSAWMDKKLPETLRPHNHDDFRYLFDRYTALYKDFMFVEKKRICIYDGNNNVPQLSWERRPVEIMYVDCGRTFEVNETWYNIFSSSFIPNKTIIIMQDWRVHREVPVRWNNQTKQFTDSKGSELQEIHELKQGHIATFLYRGNR